MIVFSLLCAGIVGDTLIDEWKHTAKALFCLAGFLFVNTGFYIFDDIINLQYLLLVTKEKETGWCKK